MATKKTTSYPKVNEKHDSITLDLGNGRRLSISRSGERASGDVPLKVFQRWSRDLNAPGGQRLGDRVASFAAAIDTIWPDWATPPQSFDVGDHVRADLGRHGGVMDGTVERKRGTNYVVRFGGTRLISIPGHMLHHV